MFCTQCGSKNNDDLERCWQCQALLVRRRPTDPGRPRRTDPVGGDLQSPVETYTFEVVPEPSTYALLGLGAGALALLRWRKRSRQS